MRMVHLFTKIHINWICTGWSVQHTACDLIMIQEENQMSTTENHTHKTCWHILLLCCLKRCRRGGVISHWDPSVKYCQIWDCDGHRRVSMALCWNSYLALMTQEPTPENVSSRLCNNVQQISCAINLFTICLIQWDGIGINNLLTDLILLIKYW